MEAINMPQVGQDIPKAKIVEWRKAVGDEVAAGEVVLVVESEKAVFEVESPSDGVLLARLYEEDAEAEVLTPVAWIGEAGETPPATGPEPAAAPDAVPAAPQSAAPPVATEGPAGRVKASPAARRAARERGIDLAAVTGTGPAGRIKLRDLPDGPAAAPASAADEVLVFDRMRRVVADRLTRSKQTVPHFYLMQEVDMAAALAWRDRANAAGGTKITINDLVVFAVGRALQEHPRLNSHVEADRLVVKAAVDVGIAVAVDEGLLVPVLTGADRLDIRGIAAASSALIADARRGVTDPNRVGTFTVSNLGAAGIDTFVPIINPPECALLGVGTVKERVVAVDGMLAVRPLVNMTLACDHRAVDGAAAAPFLQAIRMILEEATFA